jgi:hypothetical protein
LIFVRAVQSKVIASIIQDDAKRKKCFFCELSFSIDVAAWCCILVLRGLIMFNEIIFTGAVLVILAPAAVFAQTNAPGGAASGAATGAIGGAIVGGIVGDQQPQFRQYVVTQVPQSYRYESDIRVGAVLPKTGVTYYEVPAEYNVPGYRYTYVNQTPVLVDPRTRQIVQIIQ